MSAGNQSPLPQGAQVAIYRIPPMSLHDSGAVTDFMKSMGVRFTDHFCLCCGQHSDQNHREHHVQCTSNCWLCGQAGSHIGRVCPSWDNRMTLRQWGRRLHMTSFELENAQREGGILENLRILPPQPHPPPRSQHPQHQWQQHPLPYPQPYPPRYAPAYAPPNRQPYQQPYQQPYPQHQWQQQPFPPFGAPGFYVQNLNTGRGSLMGLPNTPAAPTSSAQGMQSELWPRVFNRGGSRGSMSGRTNRGRSQSGRSRGGTHGVQQGRIERRQHNRRNDVFEYLRGLPDAYSVHPASSAPLGTGGANPQRDLLSLEDVTRVEAFARRARAMLDASENSGPGHNRSDPDHEMTGIETGHPAQGRTD